MNTLYIHPTTPQDRLIKEAANTIKQNGAIIAPTPFGYALMVGLSSQKTFDKLSTYINTPAYLLCRDVSDLSQFANLNNEQFAAVRTAFKADTPPIFTLNPTKNAPKFLGKKTINATFAKDAISLALLQALQEPIVVLPFDDDTSHSDYETGETHGHLADILISIGEIDKADRQMVNLCD